MRLLILGGSGFLSGTLARSALDAGHDVTILTRGHRAPPVGASLLLADRKTPSVFTAALANEPDWDLVVDCIGFDESDARQDVTTFSGRCARCVFVSTDFVYAWQHRRVPQNETDATYETAGYGGGKRAAEMIFESTDPATLAWTILRPSHIYGPGSALGCLPQHSRDPLLIDRLRSGEPLHLVGGGTWLQHPIFAPDLAASILSVAGDTNGVGRTLNCCGPDVVPSRRYYEILADHLDVPLTVVDAPVATFLAADPDRAMYCGDRTYDLSALHAAGLSIPATPLEAGLRQHADSLTSR